MMAAADDASCKERSFGRPNKPLLPLAAAASVSPAAAAAARAYAGQQGESRSRRVVWLLAALLAIVIFSSALVRSSRDMRDATAPAQLVLESAANVSAVPRTADNERDDDTLYDPFLSGDVPAAAATTAAVEYGMQQATTEGPIRMGGEGLEAYAEAAVRSSFNRTIVYVFAGFSMREFAVNWLLHAQAQGVRGVVVGALDLTIADFLMKDARVVRASEATVPC